MKRTVEQRLKDIERRMWLEQFITNHENGYYECDPRLIIAYFERYNATVNKARNNVYCYCVQLSKDLELLHQQNRLMFATKLLARKPYFDIDRQHRNHICETGRCRKYARVFTDAPQDGEI